VARKQSPPPQLHELESLVKDEIWRHDGPVTVRAVREALNRDRTSRAYTTIMTIMARLDRKGLLRRERQGITDHYVAVMGRDAYLDARAEAEVGGLVDEFGDLALAHFAKQMSKLDPERREELRRLARDQ
jgi:predicted transcriptional regulator